MHDRSGLNPDQPNIPGWSTTKTSKKPEQAGGFGVHDGHGGGDRPRSADGEDPDEWPVRSAGRVAGGRQH
jgi:hypothetical protein